MKKVDNRIKVDVVKIGKIIERNYMKGDRTSILILGDPGIGKSSVVKQTAQRIAKKLNKKFVEFKFTWKSNGEIDYRNIYSKAIEVLKNPEKYFVYIVMRLSEREPTDFTGFPREIEINYNGKKIMLSDYKPFIWQLIASACAGFLVLDDFTNISRPDTESIAYQVVLDRISGWIEFNENLLVIAIGNTPESSSLAKALATPLVSRLRIYYAKEPTLEDWIKYMMQYDIDERILLYLKQNPDDFIKIPDEPETLDPYPCPRSWEMLARISKDITDENEFIYEAAATVGVEVAYRLKAFLSIKSPDPDELIRNPLIWSELKFEQKFLSLAKMITYIRNNIKHKNKIYMLHRFLRYLYENDRENIVTLLHLMPDELYYEFGSILLDKGDEFDFMFSLLEKVKMEEYEEGEENE